MKSTAFLLLLTSSLAWSCAAKQNTPTGTISTLAAIDRAGPPTVGDDGLVRLSEEEWRQRLTPEQFHVTRQAGTERAFSGVYWDEHAAGTYTCVGCGLPLFDAATKFKSGTGWPSFWQPIEASAVEQVEDNGLFTRRTEIRCSRCEAHLGHVFSDGPKPTGLRYCMNSAALELSKL